MFECYNVLEAIEVGYKYEVGVDLQIQQATLEIPPTQHQKSLDRTI